MGYTNETIENMAVAAENWHQHGDLDCCSNWANTDGFLWPAGAGASSSSDEMFKYDRRTVYDWLTENLPKGFEGVIQSDIQYDTPAAYTAYIDQGHGAEVAEAIRSLKESYKCTTKTS